MCLHPRSITNPEKGFNTFVRCGQCERCKNRRRWQWIGRLVLERQCHEHARFLTLTYRDDPGVLDPGHLQDFLKRYRYHYGSCRYFAVGEYGEKNGRGHFHLILYGHEPVVRGHWKANKAWDYGFSFDGSATLKSMTYVGGYVMKTGDNKDHRPFVRMSLKPGIGFDRIDQMAKASPKDLKSWPHDYRIDGKSYPLCEGGLARFKLSYLENGGLPPLGCNPEDLTAQWWIKATDRGTRFAEEEASLRDHMKELDEYGISPRR